VKAAIIAVDGATEVLELQEDLKTLQSIVGGWLEAIYGDHDEHGNPQVVILCNEEGKIHNLPVNHKATALWWAIDPLAAEIGDSIRGAVVVVGGADDEGQMLSIPDHIANMLL
jgi:hypothetical protein